MMFNITWTVVANAIGIKHERLALNIVDKNLGASYLSYLDELAPSKKKIENLVEGIPASGVSRNRYHHTR